jgi:hypothetical protein
MRFQYSTTDATQDEFDALPRLPFRLRQNDRVMDVVGLVDSGATVNVLPYEVGLQLGGVWDGGKATLRLAGTLGSQPAMPFFALAEIGDFAPVRLAFAWVSSGNVPLILGQTNFFMEFEVCFYRSTLEFEVNPRAGA